MDDLFLKRISERISTNNDFEGVRNNTLRNIIPYMPAVFRSVSDDRAPIPGPISVQIELTNRCSTQCMHCHRFSASDNGDMDFDRAIRLLDELSDLGARTVTFSGGEPTQHPKFAEIMRHARSKGLGVGVLSNGVGLSDSARAALAFDADWVRLSVDGSSAAAYAKIRQALPKGGSAFKEVMRTICELAQPASRRKLAICYTIQNDNIDDVPDMIEAIRELNLPEGDKYLVFKFAHGVGQKYLCSRKQITQFQEQVLESDRFKTAANLAYLRAMLARPSAVEDIVAGRPTEDLYRQRPTRCFTTNIFTLIDAQGDVYPCCFLYEDNSAYRLQDRAKRAEHCLGRFGDGTSLKAIWEGRLYGEVRNQLAKIDPLQPKYARCGECTRHCNHNRALSRMYDEYSRFSKAFGPARAEHLFTGVAGSNHEDVWL